jgi:hypothetical protein
LGKRKRVRKGMGQRREEGGAGAADDWRLKKGGGAEAVAND